MPEQRTEQADTILEQLDEIIDELGDSEIGRKLEDLRHDIKVETLNENDLRIMKASNKAAEVWQSLASLMSHIEKHNLWIYFSKEEIVAHIEHYDRVACNLDDYARGAA